MSYTPTQWQTGDTVTAEKLNKMENGIAGSGGTELHSHFVTLYLSNEDIDLLGYIYFRCINHMSLITLENIADVFKIINDYDDNYLEIEWNGDVSYNDGQYSSGSIRFMYVPDEVLTIDLTDAVEGQIDTIYEDASDPQYNKNYIVSVIDRVDVL